VNQYVVLAGLFGAIVWDVLTWWWGLPTSSSHALIGGYAGAAMMHAAVHSGWRSSFSVIIAAGWYKTLIFIVVAPVMGMTLGLLFMTSAYWLLRHKAPQQVATSVARCFRKTRVPKTSLTRRTPRRQKVRRQGPAPERYWAVGWDGWWESAHWRFPASDPSLLPVPSWRPWRGPALEARWVVLQAL
jgi:phosphate/sulfate permease